MKGVLVYAALFTASFRLGDARPLTRTARCHFTGCPTHGLMPYAQLVGLVSEDDRSTLCYYGYHGVCYFQLERGVINKRCVSAHHVKSTVPSRLEQARFDTLPSQGEREVILLGTCTYDSVSRIDRFADRITD